MQNKVSLMRDIMKRQVGENVDAVLHDIAYAVDRSAIVAVTDGLGKIIYVNELFSKISKYDESELIGQDHSIVNSGYHPREFFRDMWVTIRRGDMWTGQVRNRAKDGSYYWVDTVIVPFLNADGKPYQFISIRWDITEKKEMEQKVRESAEMYRIITENASDFIAVIDLNAHFKYLSPAYEKKLGYPTARLENQSFWDILHPDDKERVKRDVRKNLTYERDQFRVEFRVVSYERDNYYMQATMNIIQDEGMHKGDLVVVMQDITHKKKTEKRMQSLALNDQLTMLLNRTAYRRQLFEDIKVAKEEETKLAVVYMNIDRFRYINDSLGHAAGDELLKVVASRLKSVIPSGAIGRIAGDEFAFTLHNIMNETDAIELSEEVRYLLQEPIYLNEEAYEVTLSSGISVYPDHALKASDLVSRAEKALHIAKTNGGNRYELYQPGTVTKTLERILLENELRRSVEAQYFELEYQPKIDLHTKHYIGFEALVRWVHPDLGRIPPDKFIPLAEETKIIIPLGEWILNEACRQLRQWIDEGYPPLQMAVNMSSIQLEDPNVDLVVQAALQRYNIQPQWLEIELTESAFADRKELSETIERIRALGVSVAIDDFGTGYSTFSYIKELPIDTIKIDRAFVQEIDNNKENQAIVSAIVTLAATAQLQVVAEGIESEHEGEVLRELGCEIGQGYFYSRPIAPEECVILMDEHHQKE